MPPISATKLIANGRLKPCQIDRLYSGTFPFRVPDTAAANSGPTVNAGSMPTSRQSSTRISTGIFM